MEEQKKGSLVKGISAELQDEILAILIFNPEIYNATQQIMSEYFFYGDSYKILYKALRQFHEDTDANPTLKDMMIQVALLAHTTDEKQQIKKLLLQLNELYISESELKQPLVIKSHIEEFVKRNGCEYCLSLAIQSSRSSDGIDWGEMAPIFNKYINFNLNQDKALLLGDTEKVKKLQFNAIGSANASKKIEFFLEGINRLMNHKALIPGTLTMVTAAPGVGKTMCLVNQGVKAANDGFNNLHVFLGDLDEFDATIRYIACATGKTIGELLKMCENGEMDDYYDSLLKDPKIGGIINHTFILCLKPGSSTAEQVCDKLLETQINFDCHLDQIIIDYDANILGDDDNNTYKSSGHVYNKLKSFAMENKSVMIVASQPKIPFWKEEVLTLDAASESSQKQHITDIMLGVGRSPKTEAPVACVFVAKNRQGIANKKVFIHCKGATQQITEISEEEYERQKHMM